MNIIQAIAFSICVTCAIANCLMALADIRIFLQNVRAWTQGRIIRHALSDVEDELCVEIKNIAQSSCPSEYETAQKMAAESIQVAAMAQKIIESRDLRRKKTWPVMPMLR